MRLSDFLHLGINVDRDAEFGSACKLDDNPPQGTYLLFIENSKFAMSDFNHIKNVAAIITTDALKVRFELSKLGIALCEYPKATFVRICNTIEAKWEKKPTVIGENCFISPNVYIPHYGVQIGNNVVVEDGVKFCEGVIIGDDCVIGYGSILGCANYERCRDEQGRYLNAEHKGLLRIGRGVTVGEYTMIDKALFDWDCTAIGDGCYIGRGSDVAHGCKIGENSVIAHQVRICGNVTIGKGAKISVGSIVSNRVQIGDEAIVSIGSVVNKNVPPKSRVTGNFAIPHDKFLAEIKKAMAE